MNKYLEKIAGKLPLSIKNSVRRHAKLQHQSDSGWIGDRKTVAYHAKQESKKYRKHYKENEALGAEPDIKHDLRALALEQRIRSNDILKSR